MSRATQAQYSASANVISIRDDSGISSLSINEREFIRGCALSSSRGGGVLRVDGRTSSQIRQVQISLGRWDNGSRCTVQWGVGTRVTSLCTGELIPPSLDRPSEGLLNISLDLSPMASTSFEHNSTMSTKPGGGSGGGGNVSQYQKLLSNRILRCLERIIVIGGTCLDLETLCCIPGQWVWEIHLGLTVLDDGGNLIDACVLAAMAALRHYRKPQLQYDKVVSSSATDGAGGASSSATTTTTIPTMIPAHVKEPTPLPLQHTPLSTSFTLIPKEQQYGGKSSSASLMTTTNNATNQSSSNDDDGNDNLVIALVDPTDREELIPSVGSLTIAMNIYKEICLLDFGGGCELPTKYLFEHITDIAESCTQQLCTLLETSLQEADEQALKDLLSKLQSQQQQQGSLNTEQQQKQLKQIDHALDHYDDQDNTMVNFNQKESDKAPFFQQQEDTEMDGNDTNNEEQLLSNKEIESQAEEAFRRQVLDFNVGHIPTKVREDNNKSNNLSHQSMKQAGSLLKAMLQSVNDAAAAASADENEDEDEDEVEDTEMLEERKANATDQVSVDKEKQQKKNFVSTTANDVKMAATRSNKNTSTVPLTSAVATLDSDEEESTTLLVSEFSANETKQQEEDVLKQKKEKQTEKNDNEEPTSKQQKKQSNDDTATAMDVDDLSQAIISKKKKKKKKK